MSLLQPTRMPDSAPQGVVTSPGLPGQPLPAGSTTGGSVSPWLYLAGLCVTLAGLYAVNYGVDDPSFAHLTYGLAIAGYTISYLMRISGLSLKSIQTPAMVLFGLAMVALLTSDRAVGWFIPAGVQDDKFKTLQLVFAWMAILHSFVLTSDAAVLFACVPCMTMLALVSTHNSDIQIQNAFLIFIGAATFLMVHENYLRTRASRMEGRSSGREPRLFGGQLQLTALCLMGAIFLANLVAVPIQTLGQTLFDASGVGQIENRITKTTSSSSSSIRVSEHKELSLATGPVGPTDQELLKITSPRGLYWRGTTFSDYTGHSFTNDTDRETAVYPQDDTDARRSQNYEDFNGDEPAILDTVHRFPLPLSPYELPASDMKEHQKVDQEVMVVGGVITYLYGAGEVSRVQAQLPTIHVSPAGGLRVASSLPRNTRYEVQSLVPSEDPNLLRKASASLAEVPAPIRHTYLQTKINGQENEQLRKLAQQITQGATNNYDKATAIKDYISSQCKYNLRAPSVPRDRDVVEYFLFDSHQGYCDSFGAAMTMLCRYAGIPARLVSGFLSGTTTDGTTYTVKDRDKHVWAEVFFPHIGWVPFDATDGAEDITDRVANTHQSRIGFAAWFFSHGPLPPLIGLMVFSLLAYLIKTEILNRLPSRRLKSGGFLSRPATNVQIIRAYADACQLLARRGLARPAPMTPDEYARFITEISATVDPELGEILQRLTRLYGEYRYGPEVATENDVRDARESLTQLNRVLSKVRRGALRVAVS